MSKFKVGDKVWFAGNWNGIISSKLGDTGWWVVRRSDGTEGHCHENQLEVMADVDPQPNTDIEMIDDKAIMEEFEARRTNKYARKIYPIQGEPVMIDVYRVLDAFGVTDPAIQHALKKLLMPGERGAKDAIQELEEAAFSIRQAVELLRQKGGG